MSIAWARLNAACAVAFIAALVTGPGVTPALALDSPVAGKIKTAPSATPRKPAKVTPGKILVPSPPTKPGSLNPAGWPAAPIGDAPASSSDGPSPATQSEKQKNPDLQNSASPTPDTQPEAGEQNFFQRMIRAHTRAIESEPSDSGRRELAEPQEDPRRPTQETSGSSDPEANKSQGFLGAIGTIWSGVVAPGKNNGSEGATSAPKPAPDTSDTGGLLGKIGGILPGLLRGSDKK